MQGSLKEGDKEASRRGMLMYVDDTTWGSPGLQVAIDRPDVGPARGSAVNGASSPVNIPPQRAHDGVARNVNRCLRHQILRYILQFIMSWNRIPHHPQAF